MSIPVIQVPAIITPGQAPFGTETEDIRDLLEHTSREFYCDGINEKLVQVIAIENVAAGIPGVLNMWVELSPVSSSISTAYWAAIGGGGGTLAPLVPITEAGTGVNGTIHTILIPWGIHSVCARLVIQTPIAAALPGAFWQVQASFSGKN